MTYTTILNSEVDAESPITDLLLTRLRDNPLAVFTNDASVPLEFKLTPLLGTLTTTSGTTHTLSGLVLTTYKSLLIVMDGVSTSINNPLLIDGQIFVANFPSANGAYGIGIIDLATGVFINTATVALLSGSGPASGVGVVQSGKVSLTTASTSVSITRTGGNFDAGSVKIYGVK